MGLSSTPHSHHTTENPQLRAFREKVKQATTDVKKRALIERRLLSFRMASHELSHRIDGSAFAMEYEEAQYDKATGSYFRTVSYNGTSIGRAHFHPNGTISVDGKTIPSQTVSGKHFEFQLVKHHLAGKLGSAFEPYSGVLQKGRSFFTISYANNKITFTAILDPSKKITAPLSSITSVDGLNLPDIAPKAAPSGLKRYEIPPHIRQATHNIHRIESQYWMYGKRDKRSKRGRPGMVRQNGKWVNDFSTDFHKEYRKLQTPKAEKYPPSETFKRRLHFLKEALDYYKLPHSMIPAIWAHMRRESNFNQGIVNKNSPAVGLGQGIWNTRKRFYREVFRKKRYQQLAAMGHPTNISDERVALYFIVWHFRKSVDRGMNPNGEVWRMYLHYHDGDSGAKHFYRYLQSGISKLKPGASVKTMTIEKIKELFNLTRRDKTGANSKLHVCDASLLPYNYQHKLGGHVQRTAWFLNLAHALQRDAKTKYNRGGWI